MATPALAQWKKGIEPLEKEAKEEEKAVSVRLRGAEPLGALLGLGRRELPGFASEVLAAQQLLRQLPPAVLWVLSFKWKIRRIYSIAIRFKQRTHAYSLYLSQIRYVSCHMCIISHVHRIYIYHKYIIYIYVFSS